MLFHQLLIEIINEFAFDDLGVHIISKSLKIFEPHQSLDGQVVASSYLHLLVFVEYVAFEILYFLKLLLADNASMSFSF